jgi:LPS-assembly lipoprotein
MSSSDRNAERGAWRSLKACGLAVMLALGLSGCVEPLYGPKLGGASIVPDMQAIKVEPIPDRLGHYLENELIFALNGTGSTVTPKYRLVVTPRERLSTPIVNSVTGEAQAGDVNVDVDYRLYPIAGGNGEPITSGLVSNFVVYDRSTQRLSNVRAARDAEIRNAKVLADQIRTRLAAAFAARSGS